jgi:hypothetical protein
MIWFSMMPLLNYHQPYVSKLKPWKADRCQKFFPSHSTQLIQQQQLMKIVMKFLKQNKFLTQMLLDVGANENFLYDGKATILRMILGSLLKTLQLSGLAG